MIHTPHRAAHAAPSPMWAADLDPTTRLRIEQLAHVSGSKPIVLRRVLVNGETPRPFVARAVADAMRLLGFTAREFPAFRGAA